MFSSPMDDVRRYVAKQPRPFRVISDAGLTIYERYGVERSATALFKAILFRLPRVLRGIVLGGIPLKNPHVTLVPADFLVDGAGVIRATWYGRDTSDHIPLWRV